jgi:hypothetical protein
VKAGCSAFDERTWPGLNAAGIMTDQPPAGPNPLGMQLVHRALRRELAALDAMEAEHAELDQATSAATDRTRPFPARADALRRLSELLSVHLDREEREASPLLVRHVTATEYDAMERVLVKGHGRDLPTVAGLIMWHASPAERRELLSLSPRALGVLWRLSWRRRYARRVTRTYPTPPTGPRTQGEPCAQ